MTGKEKALSAVGNIKRDLASGESFIETATIQKLSAKLHRGSTANAKKRLIETGAFAVSKD